MTSNELHQAVQEVCATCGAACPVRTDTRAYVDLIARGRYEEAFEVIRQFNPFPSVCALICHHPCEGECRRRDVDDPVALRHLKRFAVEQAERYRRATRGPAEITHRATIGIVGSGPAGLTAACDCIQRGYAVTVYEALPKVGGLLACAVPKYRLPDAALQADLDDILALGVGVRTGVRVGRDVTLPELRARHDAIILAPGLSESRALPLQGGDHADVRLALPFLRAAALGEMPAVPESVIVIGGGNVAVDVARTAVRLGAERVRMVCLESEAEMPAWDWECREALEEGIEVINRQGPTEVIVEDGRIAGVVTRQVERVFDEEGRFAPTYFDDRLERVEGRMVILAIGQKADLGLLEGSEVQPERGGLLAADPAEGVFACGEAVSGPGSAIEAVASGHRAAEAVLRYLESGEAGPPPGEEVPKVAELTEDIIAQIARAPRVAMPTVPPEVRRKNFDPFELGYTEAQALREARRCLSCTAGALVDEAKCAACLACARICPFGVPVVGEVATMASEICQACGLCAPECPALAISIRRFEVGDIAERIVRLVRDAAAPVGRVEIVCMQDAVSREELVDRVVGADGAAVAIVPVHCAALADEVDMMKPFELGVQAVVVRRCAECRYAGADERLARRVERTRGILDEAGVGGEKLTLE